MASRKTQYLVPFQSDVQTVNAVVASWLQANGFVQTTQNGYQFYLSNNMLTGVRCFEYYFQGNQLVILGYLKSPKRPLALDSGIVGVAYTAPYANLIHELIQRVSALPPMSGNAAQTGAAQGQFLPQPPMDPAQGAVVAQAAAGFEEAAEKKNGRCAIAAFVASILCFAILFTGNFYIGGLGYLFIYGLAITGLKSKNRKGFAIAGIVLTSLSLLLFIAILVLAVIAHQ